MVRWNPAEVKGAPVANWEMTCSCGEKMQMDGEDKEEAVEKLLAVMTPDMVSAHMADKHPGDPMPSPEQTREGFLATATLA